MTIEAGWIVPMRNDFSVAVLLISITFGHVEFCCALLGFGFWFSV